MGPLFSQGGSHGVDFSDSRGREEKETLSNPHVWGWLVVWFAIALIIRLSFLTTKSPWMDEVATTLFSLGNYSAMIPLNQIVDIDSILRPLQLTPGTSAADVVHHLLVEDNHPPTYFVLAHWWMRFFHWGQGLVGQSSDGYASLWAERSLSAFFGAMAVPGGYVLAWLSSRSRLIGLLSAALTAVSPLGVFLSQEARHYTLATLMVIASLCCLMQVVRAVEKRQAPHWGLIAAWIVINGLGLTVHYFFGLTVLAEGLVMLLMLIQQSRQVAGSWARSHWIRIYIAALGSLAGSLVWLPLLLNFYGSPQTSFLQAQSAHNWAYWIGPIGQSLAGWYYPLLSPITNGYSWQAITIIVITCVLLLALYGPWITWHLGRAICAQYRRLQFREGIRTLGVFFIAANLIFFHHLLWFRI